MRALAEFIMKGRTQAVLVAVLGEGTLLFAWVSAAAVALVTLRKGFSQGAYVLLWALVPALVIAFMGRDVGPLATLLGTTAAAVVLRQAVSWQLALLMAALSGLATASLMMTLGGAHIAAIQELLQQFVQQVQQQAAQPETVKLALPSKLDIAGMIGLSNTATVVVCLLLARWWQSLLYNPGGFQQEFHQLRLAPQVTVLLLVALVLTTAIGPEYRLWAWICLVPLSVAGLGLVHGVAGRVRWARPWLAFFYMAWLLFVPVRMLLVLAAAMDSWIDFRKRLPSS